MSRIKQNPEKKCPHCGGNGLRTIGAILEEKVGVFVCDDCGEDSVFPNENQIQYS